MKKSLQFMLSAVLVAIMLLSACAPAQSIPVTAPTEPDAASAQARPQSEAFGMPISDAVGYKVPKDKQYGSLHDLVFGLSGKDADVQDVGVVLKYATTANCMGNQCDYVWLGNGWSVMTYDITKLPSPLSGAIEEVTIGTSCGTLRNADALGLYNTVTANRFRILSSVTPEKVVDSQFEGVDSFGSIELRYQDGTFLLREGVNPPRKAVSEFFTCQ